MDVILKIVQVLEDSKIFKRALVKQKIKVDS